MIMIEAVVFLGLMRYWRLCSVCVCRIVMKDEEKMFELITSWFINIYKIIYHTNLHGNKSRVRNHSR
jgi:hypothetical protein